MLLPVKYMKGINSIELMDTTPFFAVDMKGSLNVAINSL